MFDAVVFFRALGVVEPVQRAHQIARYPADTLEFTKEPINLINELDKIHVDYIILNAFNIDNEEFMYILDLFIQNKKTNNEEYVGFLDKKTVYKVEDYE